MLAPLPSLMSGIIPPCLGISIGKTRVGVTAGITVGRTGAGAVAAWFTTAISGTAVRDRRQILRAH